MRNSGCCDATDFADPVSFLRGILMKSLFLIAFALSSASTFACPNLAGHYQCKDFDTNSVQDVVLAQTGTTYKMTITADGKTVSHDYIADGVLRNVDRPEFTSRTEKSYCQGDSLKAEINGVLKTGEKLSAVVTVNLTRDGDMFDSYVGQQGTKPLNYSETCKRVH